MSNPSANSTPEPSRRNAGVVLVVDDVPETLAVLCDALDEAGYMVLVATDGASALQRAARLPPDLVLLDAVMPGLDGFEICRRLKADPATASIPVVFMTGLTETEHVVRGFGVGGADYVTKPIDPEQVLARVAAHLRTAKLVGRSRQILDLAGRAIVLAQVDGSITWQTRYAEALLAGDDSAPALREWTQRLAAGLGSPGATSRTLGADGPTVHFLGRVATGELVLMLEAGADGPGRELAASAYRLTPREIEVLAWVGKGKTNRDIGDILGMSPRTVNKHLEHIYVKLGVETRTAAAALVRSGGSP